MRMQMTSQCMTGGADINDRTRNDGGADLEALSAAYMRDGFVNGGLVLGDEEVEAALNELGRFSDAVLRGDVAADNPVKISELGHDASTKHFRLENLWKASARFRAIVHNKAMLTIVSAILNTRLVQLWSDTVQHKPAHTGGPVNWHQDGPYHRDLRPLQRTIAAWIALDDADEETGCMWMVPGSHKWGRQESHLHNFAQVKTLSDFAAINPSPEIPAADWRTPVARPVRRGEVHFHHPFTWHGSPMNRSARPRRGYSLFLLADDVRSRGKGYTGLPEGAHLREAADRYPILYRA
jgi:phytanoyl-CoA hydroxylase